MRLENAKLVFLWNKLWSIYLRHFCGLLLWKNRYM